MRQQLSKQYRLQQLLLWLLNGKTVLNAGVGNFSQLLFKNQSSDAPHHIYVPFTLCNTLILPFFCIFLFSHSQATKYLEASPILLPEHQRQYYFIWTLHYNYKQSLTSMKTSVKRNRSDETAEDNFQSTKSHKKPLNVKTVSIFMSNLDTQIHQSYAKLRKNREKLASEKKKSSVNEQTMAYNTSSLLYRTQQSHLHPSMYESYQHIPSQLSPSSVDRSQIITLDNKEVMEYIHLVYDIYNIKDPLSEQKEQTTDKFCMTNKKIKTWKDNFQREIGSASTTKHSHLHKSIELNHFSDGKNQNKKDSQYATKIEVITLQSRHASKQKNHSQSSKSSTYRFQNSNEISRKPKINITSHRAQTHHSEAVVASVPQLFRFCFMCEQPILQCNISSHQKSCEPLKQAYSKNYDELLRILDGKINHLAMSINHLLIQKSEEKIKQEFAMIKSSVKNWMSNLPPFSLAYLTSKSQDSHAYNKNWRGEFTKIQQKITKSVCSSFHLLHKLQWFSKLRENIALKYLNP